MDEFSFRSYEPECILHELTPMGYVKEINDFKPDLLFIESAWLGKENLWTRKIANGSPELENLTKHCRNKKIPIVFWCKEDPVHFETFLPVARLADFVFTTDEDCIPKYITDLKHNHVYHLHFAAQPQMHNPIEYFPRKDRFCFAGAYYKKFPERSGVLERLAPVFNDTLGLDIYDRNHGSTQTDISFPERYKKNIKGFLPYDKMEKAYKGYRYGVNINTTTQSTSMFARRVFELMASNTVVVGNHSKGLKNYFGELTICADYAETMATALKKLIEDETYYRKYRLLGLRNVMAFHLYKDRLDFIVKTVYGKSLKPPLPSVAVIIKNPKTKAIFDKQKYENKSLHTISDHTLIKNLPAEYITFFDERDYYGENYLTDLMLATRYSDLNGIGKSGHFKNTDGIKLIGNNYRYCNVTLLPTRRSIFKRNFLGNISQEDFIITPTLRGDFLSLDEFNYCENYNGVSCAEVDDFMIADTPLNIKKINPTVINNKSKVEKPTPIKPVTDILSISNLRVATILDEFSSVSFGMSCKTFPITIIGFRDEIENVKPHFLLVESAWHGTNDSWLYKIGNYARNNWVELKELIELCRKKSVPTVFWNKEDPVHYARFIDAAKLFDRIYTSDANMIDKYRTDAGHNNVGSLMFAAQPNIHNPVIEMTRNKGSFFAGSYYASRHEQRRTDMDMLFDAAAKFPFTIYDRNAGTDSEHYLFPERFRKFIKGKLPYSEINKAYKGYQIALNVNSVTDSDTMFSRRVFECLACGTPVISTPSVGVKKHFNNIVATATNVENYIEILKQLVNDPKCWAHISHLGAREVMQNHTYSHRLQQICGDLNIELTDNTQPRVTVISTAKDRGSVFRVLDMFRKQVYKNKFLWLYLYRFDSWLDAINTLQSNDVSVFFVDHTNNIPFNLPDDCLIAYMEPETAWYGVHYLSDMVMAHKYSKADIVSKPVDSKGILPCSSLTKRSSLNAMNLHDLLNIKIEGKVFYTDGFNFSRNHNNCVDV
ncbi:MAG: glycosyltransferase [Defluviitaleaceae bacterium]|nr:glycosyltransferase [Defluviitaleaceae bacterium]